MVFDAGGRLIARTATPFTPAYVSKRPGWAEQDPEVFWQALCGSCRALWDRHGVRRDRVAGVALTTQRSTVVNVDREGRPLRPAIHWLDQRKAEGLPPVGGWWGLLFRLAGLTDTIAYLQAEAEANWIRTYQPEIWKNTFKYLLLSGYLTHRLTGRFVDSVGCQVGYVPFDFKRLRWAGHWDWKWKCLPIDPDRLPRLVPPGRVLGEITARAAGQTGIPAGLAAGGRGRGQGLRGHRVGQPVTASGVPQLRHHGHHQRDPREIRGGHSAVAGLSVGRAGLPHPGSPGVPGLLDGELVQGRVRAPGAPGGPRPGGQGRDPVRQAGGGDPARLHGADSSALLVARDQAARPGSQGGHHRVRRRAHPGPPVPVHSGGAGLCAAGRQGAHREAHAHTGDPAASSPAAGPRAEAPCR